MSYGFKFVREVLKLHHPQLDEFRWVFEPRCKGNGCPHARFKGTPESCSQCIGVTVERALPSIRDQIRDARADKARPKRYATLNADVILAGLNPRAEDE